MNATRKLTGLDINLRITYRGMVVNAMIAHGSNPAEKSTQMLINPSAAAQAHLSRYRNNRLKAPYFIVGMRYEHEARKKMKNNK